MTRHHLIAVALTVAVASCSIRVGPPEPIEIGGRTIILAGQNGFDPDVVKHPDPHGPNVFIDNNLIVVDQEPIRPTSDVQGRVYIGWALSSRGNYTFPDKAAIRFTSGGGSTLPDNPDCNLSMSKKVIICSYDKPSTPRATKYEIRVVDRSGTELKKLDPWVQQP